MNFPLWNQLNDYASSLTKRFDNSFVRYDNPKYTDNMKFEGWSDTFWRSDTIGKCHLKTIQPKDAKSLWLMHINIFPSEGVELTIMGFDIVAGPKKITGSFMDFSPLHGYDHPYNEYMHVATQGLTWNKPCELPDWATEIFSKDMIAVGNIREGDELGQFISVTSQLVTYYLKHMEEHAVVSNRDTLPLLNKYCSNQKLNPHLHRSILAMGISEEDKDDYVNNVLFEEK